MYFEQTSNIKKHALNLGFFACGIAKAEILTDDKIHYENYLKRGDYGEMNYLTNYFDKRFNPALVLENTKSVIVVLWDYSNYESKETPEGKFAKYACGENYHVVIKSKLLQLEKAASPINFKFFGNTIVFKLMQSVKALRGIFSKVSGKIIVSNLLQP